MNEIRIAFVGFRHGHIQSLYKLAGQTDGVRVVAACEEHEATRRQLADAGAVEITHDSAARLLDEVDCEVIAVGDAFGRRGERAIAALSAGRHVMVDKPLCTRLEELARIRQLADSGGLQVGCMLTMRDSGTGRGARAAIRGGLIGQVHAIQFGGQHPLLYGSRPDWYWEPGMHGGTINDIGIHALDGIGWITGHGVARVEAARCWNAFLPEVPHFHDAAQMLLTLDNGCGVIGDVSYHAPDGSGYRMPYYWRTTYWGRDGVLETAATSDHMAVTLAASAQTEQRPLPAGRPGGYFADFLAQIRGDAVAEDGLTTAQVLDSTQVTLQVQAAADAGRAGVEL